MYKLLSLFSLISCMHCFDIPNSVKNHVYSFEGVDYVDTSQRNETLRMIFTQDVSFVYPNRLIVFQQHLKQLYKPDILKVRVTQSAKLSKQNDQHPRLNLSVLQPD